MTDDWILRLDLLSSQTYEISKALVLLWQSMSTTELPTTVLTVVTQHSCLPFTSSTLPSTFFFFNLSGKCTLFGIKVYLSLCDCFLFNLFLFFSLFLEEWMFFEFLLDLILSNLRSGLLEAQRTHVLKVGMTIHTRAFGTEFGL